MEAAVLLPVPCVVQAEQEAKEKPSAVSNTSTDQNNNSPTSAEQHVTQGAQAAKPQPGAQGARAAGNSSQSSDSIPGSKYDNKDTDTNATTTTTGSARMKREREQAPSPRGRAAEPQRSRSKKKQATDPATANGVDHHQSHAHTSNATQGAGHLQDLQVRNSALSDRAAHLELALKDKDAELTRLKHMVAAKTEQLPGPSVSGASGPTITEQELKQAYCSSVQALKDYITLSNLTTYDITGKNLPDKVTADIKALVHTISKVCLQILKPETPYVLETVSKDYANTTTADWELDKAHWINVIAQLQLSNLQVLSILHARELHVAKMSVLLQERAAIARQAAEITTTAASNAPGAGGLLDEVANVGVLMQHGYLYFARNVLLLHRITEMFRESLLREQKTVMELFLKVLYQVLSPVQAAIFVVEAFPYHCDVLALANVLALLFGKDGSGNVPNSTGGLSGLGDLGDGCGLGGLGLPGGSINGAGTLTPQDALMLHQHFAGGSGGGAAPDRTSVALQLHAAGLGQDMGTPGGAGGSGGGGGLPAASGGNGSVASGGPSGGTAGGGSRLNPFGATAAMAEQLSIIGQGQGQGTPSGGAGGSTLGNGGGSLSAAAIQQELQSLQAAALARQGSNMAHAELGLGLGGGAGHHVLGGGHNVLGMSTNLSSLTAGLEAAGHGASPAVSVAAGNNAASAAAGLSDLLGPAAKLNGLGASNARPGNSATSGGGGTQLFSLSGVAVGSSGGGGAVQLQGQQQQQGGTPSLNLSIPGSSSLNVLGLGGGASGGGGNGGGPPVLAALPLSALPRTETHSGMAQGGGLPISAVSRYGSGGVRGGGVSNSSGSLHDGGGSGLGAALLLGSQTGALARARLADV